MQFEGWDRIIAVADSEEDHLKFLIDVVNEYYKKTGRHHETQASTYVI